jgi:hypothetical protein
MASEWNKRVLDRPARVQRKGSKGFLVLQQLEWCDSGQEVGDLAPSLFGDFATGVGIRL